MSIIEKAAAKAGLEINHDTLPKKDRTVKAFQRLIAAARGCEAEVQDDKAQSERELNEAPHRCLEQQERIRVLEGELLQLRLKERLTGVESLTVGDRTKLLELCGGR
jgi:hypothetical protein